MQMVFFNYNVMPIKSALSAQNYSYKESKFKVNICLFYAFNCLFRIHKVCHKILKAHAH